MDDPSLALFRKATTLSGYNRLRRLLSTVFLPSGYPQSVAPEYLTFQLWNVLQDLSTYLRGILATQAILEGVGVGKAGESVKWILKGA